MRFCEAPASDTWGPMARQPGAASAMDVHPGASRSPCTNQVAAQSWCNHRQRQVRHCQKLSLGSVDSGIDLGATLGHWMSTSTDDDMRIGKVMPTLMMGHGHPLAQALAEPVTPGVQFVQHMAPVPVLARQPGDPPLENQGLTPKQPLTAAQIERRRRCHQQWAQQQREARRLQDPVGAQLEATRPTCTCCGAKLWLPG